MQCFSSPPRGRNINNCDVTQNETWICVNQILPDSLFHLKWNKRNTPRVWFFLAPVLCPVTAKTIGVKYFVESLSFKAYTVRTFLTTEQ